MPPKLETGDVQISECTMSKAAETLEVEDVKGKKTCFPY